MDRSPTVSVLIPTYNRASVLLSTLESVLQQTLPVHEVVLVDDGSTDQTQGRVREFLEQQPNFRDRVRYLYQENAGKSAALNRGIALASGEWIAFLDSDDLWMEGKLEEQFRALNAYAECGVCFTDARFVNDRQLSTSAFEYANKRYASAHGIVHRPTEFILGIPHGVYMQTLVARTELVRDVGGFDTELSLGEDTDFLFRLSRRTAFCFVNRPLVHIDRTPGRSRLTDLARLEEQRLRQRMYLFEKWLDTTGDLNWKERRMIHGLLREVHSEWASWYLRSGNYTGARQECAAALRAELRPAALLKWVLATIAPKLLRSIVTRRHEARMKQSLSWR